MRRKTAVYTITALLMGFAVMMLPLSLQTKTQTNLPLPPLPQEYKFLSDGSNATRDVTSSAYAQASQDVLPSGIILLTGIIVALITYMFFKKRMMQQ